jgi:hypothetical protein
MSYKPENTIRSVAKSFFTEQIRLSRASLESGRARADSVPLMVLYGILRATTDIVTVVEGSLREISVPDRKEFIETLLPAEPIDRSIELSPNISFPTPPSIASDVQEVLIVASGILESEQGQ